MGFILGVIVGVIIVVALFQSIVEIGAEIISTGIGCIGFVFIILLLFVFMKAC